MVIETIMIMIITTRMKIGDNSKTRHITKSKTKQTIVALKTSVNLKIMILIVIVIIVKALITERKITMEMLNVEAM